MTPPTSLRWLLRVAGWLFCQTFVLLFVMFVWATLFGEYGMYSNPVLDPITAIVFFAAALWLGSWLPLRRWRQDHQGVEGERRTW